MDIVLATTNRHKVREIRTLLKRVSSFDLYSLHDFPDYAPPEENGKSFTENALLKAKSAADHLGMWALADDSGLVVPALKGAPGIFSSRYAGEGATDKDNRKKLLHEMQNLENEGRFAYFECAIALVSPEGFEKCVSATCEGAIVEKERGGEGFGYDPLFLKHDYHQTFAELGERIKNEVSHRSKALNKMLITLESIEAKEES